MVFKPYEAIFVVLRGVLFQGENEKLRSNRNFAKKYEGGIQERVKKSFYMVFKPYEAIFVVLRGVSFQGENVNVDSPKQKLRY